MARLPNKVVHSRTKMLEDMRDTLLQDLVVPKQVNEYKLYMVDQKRGRCSYARKLITVPKWAWEKPEIGRTVINLKYKGEHLMDHWIYYLAHELAHACAGPDAHHGPKFMEWFIKICPPELQFFELGYKPKHAKAAGIKI